ncbi:Tc toxin subunit A [Yersinia kristensenii]|uniref:Tc toxin subunit A n=1 Tax=Yersinia kristensenii TaxID=28152 RepID=UPI0005E28584|nr:Tc toxin subunit A [Yersinia kristensenii]CNF35960.1 insecticial toxin complex protein [Yersinia kristensenii]
MSQYSETPSTLSSITHMRLLNHAGYLSVFDILSQERTAFIKSLPDISIHESQHIYSEARQRAESLKSLYRAWQLRQEPVIAGLKKLSPTLSQPLYGALARNIAGDGDFSDLLSRSSDYADAASIQSLFSPGRYAAALYRVAQTLHPTSSDLHIDQRRPDLKNLILSETTMHQQVTALDILLDVLLGGETKLATLTNTYFPMTLPYDDNLTQINAALNSQSRTLNGVGEVLSDALNVAVSPITSSRLSTTPYNITAQRDGQAFYLKAMKDTLSVVVYLAAPSATASSSSALLTLGPPSAAAILAAPLRLSWLPGNKRTELYLGVSGDVTLNNISLNECFLTGSNGENNATEGRYSLMDNRNQSGLQTNLHLLVTIEHHNDGRSIKLRTKQGYIGWERGGPADYWADPLVLDASEDEALAFILCKDADGTPLDDASVVFPLRADTQPSPSTRNTLALTPNSFQLLVNEHLTVEDVTAHYGLDNNSLARDASSIATTLNKVVAYCQKTGLTFNQLLSLTAQRAFASNTDRPDSRYIHFGEQTYTPVNVYGAAYLNGALASTDTERYLWVQPDGEALNFQVDTVVALAGRAGKLVRLMNQTGMSFEMLDWLIVNASQSASTTDPVRGQDILLDRPVLDALATCVTLQQRYGIDVNTFVSFIGDINAYAPGQEKSHFETCFTSLDGNRAIPLNHTFSTTAGEFTAICYQALGVTSDEFTRIMTYCFGDETGTLTLSPHNAGRIYRFGAIPRMLGLTFAHAERLWQLMADGQDTLLHQLGQADTFNALTLIAHTEQVLAWMNDSGLNLVQLQGMLSQQHSAIATAEMFTFLQNTFHSVNVNSKEKPSEDQALAQKLHQTLASGFNLKGNVMAGLLDWLTILRRGDDIPFTTDNYWQAIQLLFERENNVYLDQLQHDNTLIVWTQQLSQLVLIAHWLVLTDLDLQMLTHTPMQLQDDWDLTPSPSLSVLLLLSRFKTWQNQVTVSRDESLRLLEQLNEPTMTTEMVAGLIATVHQLDETTAQQVMARLFDDGRPQDFASLWQLLTWLRTGMALNVGAATLSDLETMMHLTAQAEDAVLIQRVAHNLSAGISQR